MQQTKTNWTDQPTFKQVMLMSAVWGITLLLILLTLTDLFTKLPSFTTNPPLCFMFLFGTWGLSRVLTNYYLHKKSKQSINHQG